MLQKIYAIMVAAIMCFGASACEIAPFTLDDVGVIVEGEFYPIFGAADELLSALGEPLTESSAPGCVYEGFDREFEYACGALYTCPYEGVDTWYEFYITAPGVETARGIEVGDAVEDVYAAYGQNFYDEGGGMFTYSISGDPDDLGSPCVIFGVENGVVVLIDIYYPINI